jgi:hypothetical protein
MRDCVQALWWGRCACRKMRAVPRLCIKLYPGIRLTTEENHGKTSVGVAEKRPTAYCWARFVRSIWWPFNGRPRPVCWPSSLLACASGDLGQPYFGGWALAWMVSLPTRHTTRRGTAGTLGVAEALAALTLQGSFRGCVRFHRYSEPTELGDGAEFKDFGTACNRHYKVRRHWAILLGVLIAAPRAAWPLVHICQGLLAPLGRRPQACGDPGS